MHKMVLAVSMVALMASPALAETGGCFKYGAAGALAGHMAGHGVLGAAGGCVTGMYMRHHARSAERERAEREHTERLNQASHEGGPDGVARFQDNYPEGYSSRRE